MIVCICKNVSESDIREMLKYSDIEVIKDATGAGTQCTTCIETIKKIADEMKKSVDI